MTAIPFVPPPSRNDRCPCGSGRLYKHCHGAVAFAEAVAEMEVPVDEMLVSGRAALQAGRPADALAAAAALLKRDPTDVAVRRLRAEALVPIDAAAANAAWEDIAREHPGDAEAYFFLGNLARARADNAAAIRHYEITLVSAPQHAGALNNLGLACEALGQMDRAENCFRGALRAAPSTLDPLANLAQNLYQQKRYAEALVLFDRLVNEHHIDLPAIWANRAVCQLECRRRADAISSLKRTIAGLKRDLASNPDAVALWIDLFHACIEIRNYEEAYSAYEEIRSRDPTAALSESDIVWIQMALAIWAELPARRARLIELAGERRPPALARTPQHSRPFQLQAVCDDPACMLSAARSSTGGLTVCGPVRKRQGPAEFPLHLGFAGSSFRHHPVPRLLVSLLEHLDRTQFRVFIYDLTPDDDNPMRRRIAACSEYRDIGEGGLIEFGEAVRRDSIDILFDLNGHTETDLFPALALRPARIQINYIGFTGSMGCSAYDYVITDQYCTGIDDLRHFVERPLYIDPCYLPSDADRMIDSSTIARTEYGLPEDGFVYCALVPTYKIVPEMFDIWMSLLNDEPSAVLWLRDDGEKVQRRLQREAALRGTDPTQLCFAPYEPEGRYLARFRLADVFLDTAPFGAHTTVNDALYSGLPVIALRGKCFHSRASASQVTAAGLGELVASDLGNYAMLARRMRQDSDWRRQTTERARAARNGLLFDMAEYARNFQEQLRRAWRDHSVHTTID